MSGVGVDVTRAGVAGVCVGSTNESKETMEGVAVISARLRQLEVVGGFWSILGSLGENELLWGPLCSDVTAFTMDTVSTVG